MGQEIADRALLDALPVAVIVTTAHGTVTHWNPAAERLYGWSAQEAVGQQIIELTPAAGAAESSTAIFERLASGQTWSGQFPVTDRRGRTFIAWVTDVPILDDAGELVAVVGVSEDMSEVRAGGRARIEGERLQLALDAANIGTWEWDPRTGTVIWDAALEEIFGLAAGDFGGTFDEWLSLVHPDDRKAVIAAVETSVADASGHEVEHRVVCPDGSVRWVQGRGSVVTDAQGDVVGMIGVAVDVTERRSAEDLRAELLEQERANRERLTYLLRASEALAGSMDYHQTLDQVAWLAVPEIADWCLVYLVQSGGEPALAAMAHRDPAQLARLREVRRLHGWNERDEHGLGRVLATGEPVLYERVDEPLLEEVAESPEHLARLRALGIRSAALVPLMLRGRVIGAMALATDESGRELGHEELHLLQDVAARSAVAIENARLFAERSRVARVLQQSLLPPQLPEVPGLEVAARYDSAEAHGQIGGDFYDLFEATPGSWLIVMGDVSGKGTAAAATTGLARHTIRASALREQNPQRLLELLNEVLLTGEDVERFCTAVCGRLRESDSGALLELASGGHPPPILLRAGGAIEVVDAPGSVIGLLADPQIEARTVHLGPGDALVLYTDGVTEARTGDTQFGLARLRKLVAECDGLDAEAVADRVVEAVQAFQAGDRRDDLAVLVLRVVP